MNTTLDNLTEKVRENRLRNLAKNVVQYQDFKTKAIIRKIDNAGYSESTLRFYIDKGISYIKNGKRHRELGNFTEYIDEYINKCIQPLTPSKYDKRKFIARNFPITETTCTPNSPVQMVLNKLNNKNYKIAVQTGNLLCMVDGEDQANGFMQCLQVFNKEGQIVRIIVEEL